MATTTASTNRRRIDRILSAKVRELKSLPAGKRRAEVRVEIDTLLDKRLEVAE